MTTIWVVLVQTCLLSVVVDGAKMVSVNVFQECCLDMPTVITDKAFMDCLPKNVTAGPAPQVSGSCVMECAYKSAGLITKNVTNGKAIIDFKALNSLLDKFAIGEWAPIINASKEACTTRQPVAKKGENCTAGVNDVSMCLSAHFVSKCPTPNTTLPCLKRFNKMKKIMAQTGLNVNKSSTVIIARSHLAAAIAANVTNASAVITNCTLTPNTASCTVGANTTTTTEIATTTINVSLYKNVSGIGMVKKSTKPKTFFDAKADCEQDGATLYVIDSPEKKNYLLGFYSDTASFVNSTLVTQIWAGVEKNVTWKTLKGVPLADIPAYEWVTGSPTNGTCAVFGKTVNAHRDAVECGANQTKTLAFMCQM